MNGSTNSASETRQLWHWMCKMIPTLTQHPLKVIECWHMFLTTQTNLPALRLEIDGLAEYMNYISITAMFLKKKLLSPPFVIKRWLEKFHQTNLVRGFSSQLPSFLNEFLGDRWSLPLCAHMRCPSSQGHLPVEERQWMGQTSKLSADGLRNLKKSQEFEISPYQSQYILYLNCL